MLGRRRFTIVLVGGLTASATGVALPSPAVAGPPKRPRLDVEVLDNSPLHMTLEDVIPAPIDVVRATIDDLGTWADWIPLFTKSVVLRDEGAHRALDARLDLPWPVADRTFIADVERTATGIEMRYVPNSGNMKDFFVTMTLSRTTIRTERGVTIQATRVSARVQADFGIPLTKGFIEWLARRKAPQMFDALEHRTRP